MNSITYEIFAELKNAIEKLGKHGSDVRVIVFTGEGKHFTAGLDLVAAMELSGNKQADAARTGFAFFDTINPL
jgi:enoyl-CoA hydratase/carnithine racemase